MNAPPRLRLRSSLMMGCAACGLAMTWSGVARAQAFQATPSTVAGTVTYDRATVGVETITVNSNSAVINWSAGPSPTNPFVFLPAGNTATFRNGINNTDFVVLNRILVSVPVRFDGHVVGQLVSASGTAPGGTLLFSTPGGIIIGASAVFDVGNLVLTTLNVSVDASGNFYDPATRGFTFFDSPLAGPSGSIVTEAGARINALSPNSYVAFVAPTINHAGNVQVNGSAAYIAANKVEMRANDGLFDIIVAAAADGTDSVIPITHSGTTGGPASTGAGDIHRIYMVAVPRNQAVTALLTGNIGFDAAVNASVENGQIILSAGYNVVGGVVDASAPVNPNQQASFGIQGGTISSALTGYAVTDAVAFSLSGGQLHATQDLTLVGGRLATLSSGSGEVVTMDGNVTLVSPGGNAGIFTSPGGNVTVAGNVLIDATGTGFSPPKSGDAGTGQGGQARIDSNGGTIAISGDATLRALGDGGSAAVGDYIGAGGNGYGGTVLVQGRNGGTVTIGGNLSADASGYGGSTSGLSSVVGVYVDGSVGQGGDVSVIGASGGSVSVSGGSTLRSNGTGGASYFTAGGRGQGDDILIQASGGDVTLTGPVTIAATGTGGEGASGGAGTGGELAIDAVGGAVRILAATSADLSGRGGGADMAPNAGGDGTGGEIAFLANADTGSIDILSFDGHVDGVGADGSNGGKGGDAGSGQGGEINITTSTNLTIAGARPGVHLGALSLTANGTGGVGGTGTDQGNGAAGVGTGGLINLTASQAPIVIDSLTTVSANGTGGAGSAAGGAGTGGQILANANNGAITFGGAASLSAIGQGGLGFDGGVGRGGIVQAGSDQGQISFTGGATLTAIATGGNAFGPGGAGGDAFGGLAEIDAGPFAGSTTQSTFNGGAFTFNTGARGGNGGADTVSGPGGRGGNATGGSVTVAIDALNGRLTIGNVTVRGDGTGGTGGASTAGQGGAGGVGTGGHFLLFGASSSSPPATFLGRATLGVLDVSIRGVGGAGGNGVTAGAGGNAAGGMMQLFSDFIPVTFGTATLNASAVGGAVGTGAAGQGGRGDGGLIDIAAGDAGGVITGGVTSANVTGIGTAGATGGAGQGGMVNVFSERDGRVVLAGATFSTNGIGGGSSAPAGTGATGTGGAINVTATTGSVDLGGTTRINMIGQGGSGGTGGLGQGGSLVALAQGGTLDLGDDATISATALGGNASSGRGGDGRGGSVDIRAAGGAVASSVSSGSVAVSVSGQGGTGANPAGRGGDGTGGSIVMLADAVGGTIAFGATSANAGGTGGDGGTGASRGGDGTAGRTTAGTEQRAIPDCTTPATCAATATGSAIFASLILSGVGAGGQGGTGGNGTGGTATLQSVGAPTTVTGAATLRADAVAGAGGTAGQAQGGLLVLSASPHSATGTTGRLQAGSVNGTANATGGAAGSTAGRWQVSATGGSSVAATDLTLAALGGTALPGASSIDALNGGTVSASGTGTFSSAGTIQVNASGTGKLTGGTIRFTAGDDVAVSNANPAANAVTIDVTDLAVTATDDVTIGAGAVTRSTNGTNVQAGDLAAVAGTVLGRTIQIASADIDLTGGIGDAGTQAVTLNVGGAAPPTQPTILGGTAQGPGYTLTAAEAARIRADALRVNAPALGTSATRNPDLIVRDLSFNGGGAGAGIGTLTIVTPGIARVQGNLLLAGARPTDGIALTGTERLELVTPNGSIRVRDAAGAPGGTLALTSNDIWAVSQTILDRLHTDPGYATRDADLADNGGSQAPGGYIEGNAVTLKAGNSLFVQNTGENPTGTFSLTGPAFGGITVGPGGLVISTTGTTPASVTAFGRRINADGTTTIGYDFFFTVDFRGGAANGAPGSPTGYSAESTFNTCVIATGQCAGRRPDDTGPSGRDPIVGPSGTFQLPPGLDDENVDTSFATEPLIEEPVTSGGESTLWTPPCDPARDQRCVGEHP